EIEHQVFDLAETVSIVAGLFAIRIEEKGLSWRLAVDPTVPRQLVGDDFRLNQVLINLIGNAVKFTDKGEVGLEIHVVDTGGGHIRLGFVVSDTGLGMSPDQVTRLFGSFVQVDASTTRKYGGTGLGLAISKRLVELMGGTIVVESALGKGSRFSFTAEFQTAGNCSTAFPPAATLSELAITAQPLRGAEILVVDDQVANLHLIRELLARLGMRAVCSDSGAAALDLVRERRFAAVLMDIQMPGIDGFETARQMIQQLGEQAPPIIALTAAAMPEHRVASQEAGMVEHLVKPIDPADLLAALLRCVEMAAREEAEAPLMRKLEPLDVNEIESLLIEFEAQLLESRLGARRTNEKIETLVTGTQLASIFAPVADAVRRLRFTDALEALIAFKAALSNPLDFQGRPL
ncbi:MAG: hypothetical protein RL563_2752, partial [Pseudomonadota bacterium]